jgi:hypothetical protein
LLAALVVLAASACCPKGPPASAFPDAESALARMKDTYACANGVKGDGKIDHFSDRGRVRGDIALFAVNPARVRIDVFSSLGAMVYTLTSNGNEFQMLNWQEKEFLHGPASACNLARLTQGPVPGHALVYLLRGEAPLLASNPKQPASISWESCSWVVDIPSTRGARERVVMQVYDEDYDKPWQQQRTRVTEVLTEQSGVVLYHATLSDHQLAKTLPERVDEDGLSPPIPPSGGECNVEIPRTIRVEVPSTGDDVEFSYQEVGFNPPLPAGAFSQVEPDGVRSQFVSCQ